ncbi:MAG TPA: site-2 protease family protein [Candidatus Angelobacter sp.]|nr:site-2 protease family protein [Candidatus Angelobacter sp.]
MIKLFKKFHIHPVFWVVLAGGLLTGHVWDIVTVFFIVMVHEMGHACVASYFKWRITAIELLPFGGVAKVDEHGNRPFKEELLVTLAGPIQHLWLPGISYLLLRTPFWNVDNHVVFLTANTTILIFNLLPIWPLDGGKFLFLLLSKCFPFKKAFRSALLLSLFFLLALATAFTLYRPASLNFIVVVIFIGFSIYQEWKHQKVVFMRFLLERWRTRPFTRRRVRTLMAEPDWPIWMVFDLFFKDNSHHILLTSREHSVIHESTLLEAYFGGKQIDHKLGEFINVS